MGALHLHLVAVAPERRPPSRSIYRWAGCRLALADGTTVRRDDPLLRAYGAVVVKAHGREGIAGGVFRPGSAVRLEALRDGTLVVLDRLGHIAGGSVFSERAGTVVAGLEAGLSHRAAVLQERYCVEDGERTALRVVIAPRGFVVLHGVRRVRARVERPLAPRLVLTVEASGAARWWDPSGESGPLEADDLPVHPDLRTRLGDFAACWRHLHEDACGYDEVERIFVRGDLLDDAQNLWLAVREELSGRVRVGFRGPDDREAIFAPRKGRGARRAR